MRYLMLALLCALTACSTGWRRSTVISGTFRGGDGDVFMESVEGGLGVAVCREDGEVLGAAALQDEKQWEWVRNDHEIVDHPRIPEFRAAVQALRDAVGREDDPVVVVDAARAVPFEGFVSRELTSWTNGRPDRAAVVLDRSRDLDLRSKAYGSIVREAVKDTTLTDQRMASWVMIEDVREDGDAAHAIAICAAAGPDTLSALVSDIDDVPHNHRTQVWEAAAMRLVQDPQHAWMLVRSIDELRSSDRRTAALRALEVEGASSEYAIRLLDEVDEFMGSDRPAVWSAAAQFTAGDPRGRRLAVERLDELHGGDRARAALALLDWPESASAVSRDLVRRIDWFHGSDREQVLMAVVEGPGFTGATQGACVFAATEELYGDRRKRVLTRIVELPGTEAVVRDRAQRALARR